MKSTKTWMMLSILAMIGACSSDKIETDFCPDDPDKTAPGICGCGIPDFNSAGKLNYNCIESQFSDIDLCPDDPAKTAPGICGCGVKDTDENGIVKTECLEQYGMLDLCPDDPGKTAPGKCGCGRDDHDSDGDTTPDCLDSCPEDIEKTEPGKCGCGTADFDEDGNEVEFCSDECPDDPNKTAPGICGCGNADDDSDGDGTFDCQDACPQDTGKTEPGVCGCGTPDDAVNMADRDGDTVIDCLDACPDNTTKSVKGITDCDSLDSDGDGVNDEDEDCPFNPNIKSKSPEGSEPVDCNYNEDGVFEIWSATDFERLQSEIDRRINDDLRTSGRFSCEGTGYYNSYYNAFESKAISCIDATHLLACVRNPSNLMYYYQSLAVIKCDDTTYDYITLNATNGSVPSSGIPTALNQSCTTTGFKAVCIDGYSRYACQSYDYENASGYKTTSYACPGGCTNTTSGDTPTGSTCKMCTGTYVNEGGEIDQCCSPGEYQSTLTEAGNYRTCVDSRVVEIQGSACRNHGETGLINCAANKDTIDPLIRAKLMRDIDLSEAYKPATYGGRKLITPKPLDLYKVDFNGNHHTITATTDVSKSKAVVIKPLINNIIESKVHDLSLSYDIGGHTGASFANWGYRSVIENVNWTGDANLSPGFFNEFYAVFGGLVAGIEETEIANCSVKGSIASSDTYTIAGLVNRVSNSYIHDSTVDLSLLSGRTTVGGAVNRMQGPNIVEKMNVSIDSFEYDSDASGFIYSCSYCNVLLDNIKVDIGSVFQNTSTIDPYDDYYFYGLINDTKKTDVVSNIDIRIGSTDIASEFNGISDAAHLKGNINITLGDIRSSDPIYAVGSNLYGSLDNSKIQIHRLNTWYSYFAPSIYGLAWRLGSSANPLSIKNVDIHIDSIESDTENNVFAMAYYAWLTEDSALSLPIDNIETKGTVYISGYTPERFSGTLDIGKIRAGKDIYTLFNTLGNYDHDCTNTRIHVKDAKSDAGNIYLLGKETKYSGTVDHISTFNNIAVQYDRAEAQSVLALDNINSVTHHLTGLSDIAIYADAYTHAETQSSLFANTIDASAGLLELTNIVLNTRLSDCSETDESGKEVCNLYNDLNYAVSVTSEAELDAEYLFARRWDVEQRVVNPMDAEVAPFGEGDNAFTTEEVVELLGDKWELRDLGVRDDSVKVPWLK